MQEGKTKMDGYLFVHFAGEAEDGEQIYFAVSGDGLHWTDLNHGKPVLRSGVGQMGVRDPFIVRMRDGSGFFIVATDLRMADGQSWEDARTHGSRSVVIWESKDLIHWSRERLAAVGIAGAGCVWAPEVIYCEEKQAYMMFWASMVKEPGETKGKQRIYRSLTKDFVTFSEPVKYIEKENDVIDTTIVKDGAYYYRFSKNESTGVIQSERGKDLLHGPFEELFCEKLEKIKGVEGPEAFRFHDSNRWCLIVDQFATGGGYLPLIAEHIEKGDFAPVKKEEFDMGEVIKRHGSVIPITGSEMAELIRSYS